MNELTNRDKKYKLAFIIVAILVFVGLVVSIPSLAKLKNRNTIYTVSSWDGSVASSYRKGDGSLENPYVISNGSELAFFINQLQNTDYSNKYFELSNDIIINSGVFDYSETEGIKYLLEGRTYYVKENTNEYYDNPDREGDCIGRLNSFEPIKNFKGNFNGKSFTIFGLYLFDSNSNKVSLFESLEGILSDIYISNSMVYGSGEVSGIAVNSDNAELSNVLYEGTVVNKTETKISEVVIEPIAIASSMTEIMSVISLPNVDIDGVVKSIKLVGEYEATNEESINTIKINGVELASNSFEVDLTLNTLTELPIYTLSTVDGTIIELKNLVYKVEYMDDISAGLIVNSGELKLQNVINRANVFGNYISAGFVGKANDALEITQSYNNGNIKSNYIASGLIGIIKENEKDIKITNVYNGSLVSSPTSAAIISVIKDCVGKINIDGVVNVSENYSINTIENSFVKIDNSYTLNNFNVYNGVTEGAFIQTQQEKFYSKEFMSSIGYNSFVNLTDVIENPLNVWIYENNSLPILYIDDLNNPIANVNINKYSWNNLSSNLNLIDVSKNIIFSIDDTSAVNPIKEKFYYITNSRVPLTENELNSLQTWSKYENPVTIEESGYYVIYAKIIDINDNVTYINTDIMVLNVSGFKTSITIEDQVWETFKSDLQEIYLNKKIVAALYAHDDLLSINSIEYYISDKKLTEEDLNELQTWNLYNDSIIINSPGRYIIYGKITDSQSNVRYINTDILIYGGYNEVIKLGNNNNCYDTNYINSKSNIKLEFDGNFEINYKEGYTHNLISNTLLPEGTKITIVDKANNKIYRKTIDSSDDLYGYQNSCEGISNCSKHATYSFNLFKEIGTIENRYYSETINYNKTISKEKYIITIDFSEANIIENYYDLSFYLAIKTSAGETLYSTLNETIGNINVYSSLNNTEILTKHNLISDYNNQTVYYNSNSELAINFENVLEYSILNDKKIIDTSYDNKKSGIVIKLYDELGAEISKQYLDNMIFEVGGREFFANSDNSIKINFGSATSQDLKTLIIKTKENSSGLQNGKYYLKIGKYISNDGYNYDKLYDDEISITLIVENQEIVIPNYSFDVVMTTDSIILDKTEEKQMVSFNTIWTGSFVEPNIRVSLYKKNDLTAYNQNYTLVDIAEYSSDSLINAETNKYFVDTANTVFNLNVLTNKFDNTGYKYVFELYDGSKKIGKIEKYFIVK